MNVHPDTAKEWLESGIIDGADYEALIHQPKNKYNARRTNVDGIVFHSGKEAARYSQLKILEKSGEIKNLRLQVKIPIDINGIHVCNYIADFVYDEGSAEVVEDAKGKRTDVYQLKKKLMLAVNSIKIRET